MRITRLKLVNFIGIKAGMDLDEIELDFTRGNNKIVMLRGGNGSGKTTIERQLNPFKGDKGDLIIAGCDGRKEIDIENNGTKYEIVHVYSKTGQSFIKKDGVELNPNGGLGTFKELLLQELDVDESYKSIGSIGNNAASFIEMKPAERKGYIANLIGTEEYDDAFDTAREKYNELKKDIKKAGDDLAKYPAEDVLNTEVEKYNSTIAETDQRLLSLYSKEGTLKAKIDQASKEIGDGNITDINTKIASKESIISSSRTTKESALKMLSDVDVKSPEISQKDYCRTQADELQKVINNLNSKIEVNSVEKNHIETLRAAYKNKISGAEIKIKGLGDPEKSQKLEKEIAESNETLKNLKEALLAIDQENPAISHRGSGALFILNSVQKFKDFSDFIEKYYTDLAGYAVSRGKRNIQYFLEEDFESTLSSMVRESRNVIAEKTKILEEKKAAYNNKLSHAKDEKILEKRPSDCKIDTCPFIEMLLQYRGVNNEISLLEKEINQIKAEIDALNTKADNLAMLKSLYLNFKDAYGRVQPRSNDVYAYFLKRYSLVEWLSDRLSEFQEERSSIIESTSNAIEIMQKYKTESERNKSLEKEKEVVDSSDALVREKYEADLQEAITNLDGTETQYADILAKGKNLANDLDAARGKMELYSKVADAISTKLSAETQLSEYKKAREVLVAALAEKTNAEEELASITNEVQWLKESKKASTDQLIKIQTMLKSVQELNTSLKKLNETFEPVNTVKNALDSKCGIPLILINTYLTETQSIVNRLLDIPFKGKFRIKFLATDKEFSIKIFEDGTVKSDVSVASQGEVSIITISLCLALIQQSLKKYNIVCLDEIDGALDKDNRHNFINILNSQIDAIGIEQVFIISHNDAFDTANVDLVLLKKHNVDVENESFMKGKSIIYEYRGN